MLRFDSIQEQLHRQKKNIVMINRVLDKPFETAEETQSIAGLELPQVDLSKIKDWRREVEKLIGDHPAAALGIAVGVGFLIGWWNKRK